MSLIHRWLIDDTLNDYGTAHTNLTQSGTTVVHNDETTNLKVSRHFSTDGNYLRASDLSNIVSFTQYTLSCWAYVTNTSTNHSATFLSSGNWNTSNKQVCFGLSSYNSGYTKLLVPNKTSFSTGITIASKIALNTLHHYIVTFDGTTTRAYIDGELIGTYNGGGIQTTEVTYYNLGCATYYNGFTIKGNLSDFRIYDSVEDVDNLYKESKQVLLKTTLNKYRDDWGEVLHFKFKNMKNSAETTNPRVMDNSEGGVYFGNIVGSASYVTDSTAIGGEAMQFGSSSYIILQDRVYGDDNYWNGEYKNTTLPSTAKSLSIWFYPTSTTNQVLFADTSSKLALGLYNNNSFIVGTTSRPVFLWNNNLKLNAWNHVVVVYESSATKCYLNGVSLSSSGNNSWTSSGSRCLIGCRNNGNFTVFFTGKIADVRVFTKSLVEEDVKKLYNIKGILDNNGSLYSYTYNENTTLTKSNLTKTSIKNSKQLCECLELSDGSLWVPFVVHDVSSGKRFTKANMTNNLVYVDDGVWCDWSLIESVERPDPSYYELLCTQQKADSSVSYRWKQTISPLTATWNDVTPSTTNLGTKVIRISPTTTVSGGLYILDNSNTYGCFANATNGNWYGCCAYNAYNGGEPGYNNEIVTKWQIVYIRVTKNTFKEFKNGMSIATELREEL